MQLTSLLASAVLAFSALIAAHPGEHHEERSLESQLQLRAFKDNTRRGLALCQDKLKRSGVHERAVTRRKATVDKHSKKKRDTATVLATDHESNLTGITASTSQDSVFTSSGTCVLNPEGEVGPFYVPGELIRADVRDNQSGVPTIIEAQFVDVSTCEPISGLWWDVWNCNSTGVYGGVVSNGNGNSADESNINATFLRGLQETDADGVVQFQSIFPGHYSGRTNHVHMVAHLNATLQSNNTVTGGTVPHIGQFFWDQDLIDDVEATYPYSTNNVTLTTNAEDHVFGEEETTDTTSDPVFEYVYLGDSVSDGLFAWVTVAVNISATYDPTYSFVYTSGGGVAESSGNRGSGGGGNGTGNGTFPSGPAPSGF